MRNQKNTNRKRWIFGIVGVVMLMVVVFCYLSYREWRQGFISEPVESKEGRIYSDPANYHLDKFIDIPLP